MLHLTLYSSLACTSEVVTDPVQEGPRDAGLGQHSERWLGQYSEKIVVWHSVESLLYVEEDHSNLLLSNRRLCQMLATESRWKSVV